MVPWDGYTQTFYSDDICRVYQEVDGAFDRRDPEQHLVALTRLKKTGSPETYIADFLTVSVMVPDLSAARMIYMFVEGLAEPLRGLVRSTRPATLQDAISRTRDLQDALPRTRTPYPRDRVSSPRGRM